MKGIIWGLIFVIPIYFVTLFLSSTAYGDVVVNIVHARGQNGMHKAEVLQMLADASAKLQAEIGEPLRILHFKSIRNPFQADHNSLNNTVLILARWENYFRSSGNKRNIAIIPPIKDGGTFWLAGYTSGKCGSHGVSYTVAEMKNSVGQDRFTHSMVGFLHELGHELGCSHDATTSIMNANAYALVDGNDLHYSDSSKNQIYACLNK